MVPDGRFIAYTVSTRETVDETPDISGAKLVFRRFPGTPPDLWAAPVLKTEFRGALPRGRAPNRTPSGWMPRG